MLQICMQAAAVQQGTSASAAVSGSRSLAHAIEHTETGGADIFFLYFDYRGFQTEEISVKCPSCGSFVVIAVIA